MHARPPKIETVSIDDKLDVNHRLEELRECYAKYEHEDNILLDRIDQLTNSYIDRQRARNITAHRRRLLISQAGRPLEILPDVVKKVGLENIRENLVQQYARLTTEDKLLWLNNLFFIMVPDLRKLNDKIAKVRRYNSMGQQRNFLLGGQSGMGKTTYLDWYSWIHLPTVEYEYNRVPVVKIDAPTNQNTARPLYRRIILATGLTYLKDDDVDTLLENLVIYLQKCRVEVLIIDEVEHLKKAELKRCVLEISNMTRGIPIICASCHPLSWIQGDPEIKGRWNDFHPLKNYKGKRLGQLLAFIELLLPFTKESSLGLTQIEKRGRAGKITTSDGPATLIEKWTKGVLRDVMILIRDASERAIEQGKPHLTTTLLQEAWRDIQTQEANRGKQQDEEDDDG